MSASTQLDPPRPTSRWKVAGRDGRRRNSATAHEWLGLLLPPSLLGVAAIVATRQALSEGFDIRLVLLGPVAILVVVFGILHSVT